MLNLFLTAVSNTVERNANPKASSIKDEKAILEEYCKQYRKGSPFTTIIGPFLDRNNKKENEDSNNDDDNFLLPR